MTQKSPLQIPRLYGLVVLINLIGSFFVMFRLGMSVGMARSRFIEKAKKNGDKDAEARFSYPKIYAEGFSKEANDFNCVQRGHQQALETYPTFLILSTIGGLAHPITTSMAGLLWGIARLKWAAGYASGDPSKRYGSMWGMQIWTSVLALVVTSGSFALRTLGV